MRNENEKWEWKMRIKNENEKWEWMKNENYKQNKEAIKEKSREHFKNLSQEEKDKIKKYQRKRYQKLAQYKK